MSGKFKYTHLALDADKELEDQVDDIVGYVNSSFGEVKRTFDVLGINFGYTIDVTGTVSGQHISINHGLGAIPDGFIVTNIDQQAFVYNGASAWTSEYIWLKTNKNDVSFSVLVFTNTN